MGRLRTKQAYFRGVAIAVESSHQCCTNPQRLAPDQPILCQGSTGAQGAQWSYGHGGKCWPAR